jgi:replicative DNA helicase
VSAKLRDYFPEPDEATDGTSRNGRGDELPPSSQNAEMGVLGCILIDPDMSMDQCAELLARPGMDAFYDLRHQEIYAALCLMWEGGVKIDLVTLQNELSNRERLDAVGGQVYLSSLCDTVPSAAMLGSYVEILLEKWTCRTLMRFGRDVIDRVKRNQGAVSELVAEIQTDTLKLTDGHLVAGPMPATKIMAGVYEMLRKSVLGRKEITGIATNLRYLDNMTGGLQAGEMFVIGARPSIGKTALGVTLALAALRQSHPVLFFSVEMSEIPIGLRILGAGARVDARTIRNGFLSTEAAKRIEVFAEESSPWMRLLLVDTRSDLNGRDLFVTTRRAIRDHGVKLIVVDYLQLMAAVKPSESRVNEVSEMSRWVKRTAKDLGVSVICLAQLNRETAKSRHAIPSLADLRESGQIEQDADLVGLMYRPDLGREPDFHSMKWITHHEPWSMKQNSPWIDGPKTTLTEPKNHETITFPTEWRAELDLIRFDMAKNRNGETGPCDLVFQKRCTAFVDAYKEERHKHQQKEMEGIPI